MNDFRFFGCKPCWKPVEHGCRSCQEQEEEPVQDCGCNRCGCPKPELIEAEPVCCRPCWDTCKCMDEIIKLQEGCEEVHTELNNIEGRFIRDEKTILDNYNYLSKLIGDLAEKEEEDIRNERNRATGEEQRIEGKLDDYIESNDAALAAEVARATVAEDDLRNALQNEIARATGAEAGLNNAVAGERQRATAAEDDLRHDLEDEIEDRRQGDELLQENLNNESDARIEEDQAIRQLIGQVQSSLVNYYTKGDTYNRDEIQQILSNIRQFQYVIADSLPTATKDTMGYIYLIPSTNPQTQNVRDEFLTVSSSEGSVTTYKWEQIGSTTVDLSGYSTTTQIANTYLTKSDASNTYLTKTDANNTYVTKTSAGGSYQPKGNYATTSQAISGASVSGNIMTFTRADGTSFSVTLPNFWTDNGSTLTPASSGRSVTAAGFYDSTI